MAHQVPLEQPWRGLASWRRWPRWRSRRRCEGIPKTEWRTLPLLLCVAEKERPGRLDGPGRRALPADRRTNSSVRFAPRVGHRRAGPGRRRGGPVRRRATLIDQARLPRVLIVATDSLLTWPTLSHYEQRERLLTAQQLERLHARRGGRRLARRRPGRRAGELVCTGIGFARENGAHRQRGALARRRPDAARSRQRSPTPAARCTTWTSASPTTSGEQYYFKEAALALSRTAAQAQGGVRHLASGRVHRRDRARPRRRRIVPLRMPPARKDYTPRARTSSRTWPTTPASAPPLSLQYRVRGMSNQVYANNMEVLLQAGGGQVDLRLSRRLLHAAADAGDAARRADSVSEHRHGLGHDRWLDQRQDLRPGGHAQEQESTSRRAPATRPDAAPKKGVVTSTEHWARCTSPPGRWT